jgi:hypothetical protein
MLLLLRLSHYVRVVKRSAALSTSAKDPSAIEDVVSRWFRDQGLAPDSGGALVASAKITRHETWPDEMRCELTLSIAGRSVSTRMVL